MVFWGEESIATTLEILRAQELAVADDVAKNEKLGMPLIAFSYVH